MRAFRHLLAYLASAGAEGKVADLTLARQEGFMKWARDGLKLSNKTISTYLSYVKAGLRFCSRPHLIRDARGREREVQIISGDRRQRGSCHPGDQAAQVRAARMAADRRPTRRHVRRHQGGAAGPRGVLPLHDHGADTWARPKAIIELSVLRQVDFAEGIVSLNPPGRAQNKKRRPRIRLTDNLLGWLLHWNLDKPITYYGRAVGKVDNRTVKKIAAKAGIDPEPVNHYVLRHYMATRIRRVQEFAVTREERAEWLGHADPKHK
jgi:hypothetical protein